jgi:hypothetical protein
VVSEDKTVVKVQQVTTRSKTIRQEKSKNLVTTDSDAWIGHPLMFDVLDSQDVKKFVELEIKVE